MSRATTKNNIFVFCLILVFVAFAATTAGMFWAGARHSFSVGLFEIIVNTAIHVVLLLVSYIGSAALAGKISDTSNDDKTEGSPAYITAMLNREVEKAFSSFPPNRLSGTGLPQNYSKIVENLNAHIVKINKQQEALSALIKGNLREIQGEPINAAVSDLRRLLNNLTADIIAIGEAAIEPRKYEGAYRDAVTILSEKQRVYENEAEYISSLSKSLKTGEIPKRTPAGEPAQLVNESLKSLQKSKNDINQMLAQILQYNLDINVRPDEGSILSDIQKSLATLSDSYSTSLNALCACVGNAFKLSEEISRSESSMQEAVNRASYLLAGSGGTGSADVIRVIDSCLSHTESISAAADRINAESKFALQTARRFKLKAQSDSAAFKYEPARVSPSYSTNMSRSYPTTTHGMSMPTAKPASSSVKTAITPVKPVDNKQLAARSTMTSSVSSLTPRPAVKPAAPFKPTLDTRSTASPTAAKERTRNDSSPPITPRPKLSTMESGYNFESTDYGKYSR